MQSSLIKASDEGASPDRGVIPHVDLIQNNEEMAGLEKTEDRMEQAQQLGNQNAPGGGANYRKLNLLTKQHGAGLQEMGAQS